MAAIPGAVFAQDTSIEQVVVSASRISIAGYSQPTPVTVVGAAQLEQNAYANIQDSVRQLPQLTSPNATQSANQGGGNGANGANNLNLRNLGFVRTLVLLDGQRVAQYAIGGGVDTTLFPSNLVQRVDIVTGGASASWGSDAVAGVVNFVLNKNFNGFKATLQAGDTTDGLVRQLYGDAAWGGDIFGGRGHLEVSAQTRIMPDNVLLKDEGWWRNAYWVSNPAYVAGNGQPQLIVANNVGSPVATTGGLITASAAGVAGPGVVAASANALRGIEFVGGGTPQLVNFGNNTRNAVSNGGSLTAMDGQWAWQQLATPSNVYTLFLYGRYKVTDTIQASAQIDFGYFTGKGEQGDTPAISNTIKSDNAFIPATVRSAMQNGGISSFTLGNLYTNTNNGALNSRNFYSMVESGGSLGPSISINRRTSERAVFTLEGTIGDEWSWNAYAQHSTNRLSIHKLGDTLTANVKNAIDAVTVTSANVGKTGLPLGSIACRSTLTSGGVFVDGSGATAITALPGCIPLNSFGENVISPAAIAYVTAAGTEYVPWAAQSLQQSVIEGSMQGVLPWELPAGKIAVAFGGGYRREQNSVKSPTLQDVATKGGYAQQNIVPFPSRSYNVMEGFAEVNAPILKNNIVDSLDVSMAGRITSYSTSGQVETWKLGATSQINEDVKLRTTWSVDIRAPILNELYNPGSTATGVNVTDPKTNLSAIVIRRTTGNANLVPETARTISGGVVLTPSFIPGLSLSADWYNINVTNVITTINEGLISNACNPTVLSSVTGKNGSPSDPLCQYLVFNGPNGALSQVNLVQVNLNAQRTSGLDVQANYTMDFWEGTLNWQAFANLNDENTLFSPLTGIVDQAGNSGVNLGNQSTAGPKWRGIASVTYAAGPYNVTVQGRWWGTSVVDGSGNTGQQATSATANLYDPAHFHVPFSAYLDLRGNYKWNDNISFFAAIDNALNTPPPLKTSLPFTTSGSQAALQVGSSITQSVGSVYDLTGRAVRVGIRLNY